MSRFSRTALTLQSYDSVTSQYKPILRMPVLQIVGARSPFIDDTAYINSQLDPAKRDWLKVPTLTCDNVTTGLLGIGRMRTGA